MADLLITASTVITMDEARRVIDDGAVVVHDGVIVDVGPTADVALEAERHLDFPNGVALPGLVDAHSHAGHGLIRTMADDLGAWMDACDRVYLHGATPDFWRAEARLTGLERLLAGVTTSLSLLGGAGDFVRCDDPAHGDAFLSAYAELGLRAVMAVGPGAPPFPKRTTGPHGVVESSFTDQMAVTAALAEGWASHPTSSVATTYPTLTPDQLGDENVASQASQLAELAARHGLLIVQDGHRAETVDATDALGLLGQRTLLSHAVDLTDAHIELIAERGAAVAHNPSAVYSQFGRCPAPELLEAGVTVGLGSDATAPDRSADMFRHMFQLTRYHRADRRDPAMFPPGTALELATLGSARALGMADEVGSLEVGKAADVIVVDTAKPHLTPFTHPVHQLVYFATGADVDTVIVGGDVLMHGRHQERVDAAAVMDEARAEQRHAFERVGLDPSRSRPGLWGEARYPEGPGIEL